MSYEVEIKAHADEALKPVIDALTKSKGEEVVKSDTYYAFPGDISPRFRIRRENDFLLITAKENHRDEGLECNREVEFVHKETEDLETMEEMADLLGYKVFIHKYKKGWSWMYQDVHIELLDVKYLGCYLEMEIISEEEGFESNSKKFDHLYKLLELYGLTKEDVET